MTRITAGSSRQWTEGIGVTIGGAKTLDTLSIGLCSMKPAHTARSRISRVRIRTRLSVARLPALSRPLTVWMTSGAVISSSWREPIGVIR